MNLAIKGFSNDVNLRGESSFFLLVDTPAGVQRLPVLEETVSFLLRMAAGVEASKPAPKKVDAKDCPNCGYPSLVKQKGLYIEGEDCPYCGFNENHQPSEATVKLAGEYEDADEENQEQFGGDFSLQNEPEEDPLLQAAQGDMNEEAPRSEDEVPGL